jgi:pseudaminic acid biosynthesis-associated methylase
MDLFRARHAPNSTKGVDVHYKTDQENFWAGEFGDSYVDRSNDAKIVAANIAMFARIFSRTRSLSSFLELGSNVGQNLIAIKGLFPDAKLKGVEINKKAFDLLQKIPGVEAHLGSILEYKETEVADLAFTSGVLMHINPAEVPKVYAVLFNAARRYVLLVEYYNPTPVEVSYRGHSGRLFKRDWPGEMMALYPNLQLLDYGFFYRRDPFYRGDDINWFLLQKA